LPVTKYKIRITQQLVEEYHISCIIILYSNMFRANPRGRHKVVSQDT